MKLDKDSDYTPACDICEYSLKVEITEEFLCRYKDNLKKTPSCGFCKNFSLDLLSIKPYTRKPIELEFAQI